MSLTSEPVDIPLLVELSRHETQPGWADLAKTLARDPSNVRRSVKRLCDKGALTLDPWQLSAEALAIAHAMRGASYTITLDQIAPSPLNPRKHFDPDALATLAASITAKGLLQPILVRPAPASSARSAASANARPQAEGRGTEGADAPEDQTHYQIIAGERRWRALQLLVTQGDMAADAPVATITRECTDLELIELAIAENRDREDVHPLEEAEAYAAIKRLRAEAGEDEGQVTAELAQRAGVTRRHIQKRIALHERLSPAVREAFRENRISLAQALAISPHPDATQTAALDLIERGAHGWSTGEEVAENLRTRFALAADKALFAREDYDGPVVEDDDGAVSAYLDRAQAEALQYKALDTLAEARRAQGWAAVEICETSNAYWEGNTVWEDDRPKDQTILKLALNTTTLALEERLVKLEDKPGKTTASPGAPAGPDLSYQTRHWTQARADKTTRLQIALTAAPEAYALAITVIALCTDALESHGFDQPRCWMRGYDRSSEDRKHIPDPAGKLLAHAAAPLRGKPGIRLDDTGFAITDPARALGELVTSPALGAIHAAAIARQCGAWIGHGAPIGDGPFLVELARQLQAITPPWDMSEAWLKNFNVAQLERIADACVGGAPARSAASATARPQAEGRGTDAPDGAEDWQKFPAKKADAIAWILNHPARDTEWTPPEMAFAPGAQVLAGVAALMEGNAATAAQPPHPATPEQSPGESEEPTERSEGGQEE